MVREAAQKLQFKGQPLVVCSVKRLYFEISNNSTSLATTAFVQNVITAIAPGQQTLQQVTTKGNVTTTSIEANSFVKTGATGTNILLDDGNTLAVSSKENSLGNPAQDGYVLSSTTTGTRNWVAQAAGFEAGFEANFLLMGA